MAHVWEKRLRPNSLAAYGSAVLCVGVAIAIRLVAGTSIGEGVPFATLFPAVLLATLVGGVGAGIAAVLLGGLAASLLFGETAIAALVLYALSALVLIAFGAFLRTTVEKLESGKRQVQGAHERLVAALAASGSGTWRWHIPTDVVEWDAALCQVYGIAPEKAPQSSGEFISLIHPEDREFAGEVIRSCVEEGVDAEYEFRAITPNGTRWIYDRSTLVRDAEGKPAYMTGACLDVTERRRAEEDRDRMGTWLRMAMEVAQIGTWEFEPRTQRLTASESIDAMFGLKKDEGTRTFDDFAAMIHPEDVEELKAEFLCCAEEKRELSAEYRLMRADGTIRWIAARGDVVASADGTERLVGALFDITERKLTEEERQATLEQRDLLLKELNHRVKNNLQMISSLLELQAARLADPSAREHFEKAIQRVGTISDLHARLYLGERIGQVDFDQYLKELCDRLRKSMLDGRRISLDVRTEPSVLELDRAVPLGLIVNELVTNAIKYAFPPDGEGSITVELRRGEGGSLLLSVADNGRGLRGDAAQTTGLGMRLVNGLVRQVGGTLEAKHQAGVHYDITVPPAAAAEPIARVG